MSDSRTIAASGAMASSGMLLRTARWALSLRKTAGLLAQQIPTLTPGPASKAAQALRAASDGRMKGLAGAKLSGVEAINGGLGIAVTKSWGMVDNRTISAITPVDECTSDVRFIVYIGRTPGKEPVRAEAKAQEFGREVIRQFEQDVEIWQHQRYSDPPALATSEYEGFTAIRKWAKQFYPDGIGGSAAEVHATSQKG